MKKGDKLTLLHIAIRAGDEHTACTLLEKNADPRVPSDKDQSAIDLANESDMQHLLSALREKGYIRSSGLSR